MWSEMQIAWVTVLLRIYLSAYGDAMQSAFVMDSFSEKSFLLQIF